MKLFLISFLTFFWILANSNLVLADHPADMYLHDDVNATSHDPAGPKKHCPVYPDTCYGRCSCSSCKCGTKSCKCNSLANTTCFSAGDTVRTPYGIKLLGEVEGNDLVLTVSEEGRLKYERVLLDAHPLPDVEASFFKIQTPDRGIMLTPKHFIYIGETVENSKVVKSDDIRVGDPLLIYSSGSLKAEKVEEIEMVRARGISNPVVSSGKILVNDVLASIYSDVAPTAVGVVHQHQALWITRQVFKFSWEGVFRAYQQRGSNGLPLVANYFFQQLVGVRL